MEIWFILITLYLLQCYAWDECFTNSFGPGPAFYNALLLSLLGACLPWVDWGLVDSKPFHL